MAGTKKIREEAQDEERTRRGGQTGRSCGKDLGVHPMSKQHPLKDVKQEWLPKVRMSKLCER